MVMNKWLKTEEDTLLFAAQLAKSIDSGAIIFLSGPLGAGKTTFIRGFLRGLGHEGKVKSPTYALVEPYDINGISIFHFDLYRIKDATELEHMGIRDYFTPEVICLIEWPEKGFPLLPDPDLACFISVVDEEREIRIEARSVRGETILGLVIDAYS